MDKIYLGDGVYAEFDGYQIQLYASNGVIKSPTLYLDVFTADTLIDYIHKCFKSEEK